MSSDLTLADVQRFRLLNAHLYPFPWYETGGRRSIVKLPKFVCFVRVLGLVRICMTSNVDSYLQQMSPKGELIYSFPGGSRLRSFFKGWFADRHVYGSSFDLSEADIRWVIDHAPYREE